MYQIQQQKDFLIVVNKRYCDYLMAEIKKQQMKKERLKKGHAVKAWA